MKATPLLFVALFAAGCSPSSAQRRDPMPRRPLEAAQKAGEAKTSTDPQVNPNAAVMADFKARVEKYAELHKDLAKGAAAAEGQHERRADQRAEGRAGREDPGRARRRQARRHLHCPRCARFSAGCSRPR